MNHKYIYTSLTRISDLAEKEFEVKKLNKDQWKTGDYVVCKILNAGSEAIRLELPNGRMRGIIGGEYLIGALGERFATLEATGSWRNVEDDFKMTVLTAAGLLGKLTSKSAFIPKMIKVSYIGHALRQGEKLTMGGFVKALKKKPFPRRWSYLLGLPCLPEKPPRLES